MTSGSDFVFEQGDPIDVGSHGADDFVYAGGEPVLNNGDSSFVFENGTGLGGGVSFQYATNGGSLSPLEPIATAESHKDFFNHDDGSGATRNDYGKFDVTTVLVHHDTSADSYAVMILHSKYPNNGDGSVSYSEKTSFSQPLDSTADIIRGDDDVGTEGGGYTTSEMRHKYNQASTDGAIIDASPWSDVTFTFTGDYDGTAGDSIKNRRIIYEDGSPPDGGAVETAGANGSIRLVINGI